VIEIHRAPAARKLFKMKALAARRMNEFSRTCLNRRPPAGRDGNFNVLFRVWSLTYLALDFAFGFAFGIALRTTSGSGDGGSSRGASLRVSKGDDIVLVDSAVGAAMLVSGAAIVVRMDSPIGADNVRTAVPGAEGDIEPLLADGRSESVAAGKAVAVTGTPAASARKIAGAARLATSGYMFSACKGCWCHKGISLRNFKRRTLKLASVRRDIPSHDCGLVLVSGLTSSWVIIHQ
jgi:hypothetical protein